MSGGVSEQTAEPLSEPMTYQEAIRLDRKLRSNDQRGHTRIRINLGGNANVDFLAAALRVQLATEGFDCDVRSSIYGNWISEAFDRTGVLDADAWIIWLSGIGATRGMTDRPQIDVDAIASAIDQILARGSKVVLVLPEPLPVEDDPFSPFTSWRLDLIRRLRSELPPSVVQLSIDYLVSRVGMGSWSALRYWEQAKAPCHPDSATALGRDLAVIIARLFRPAVRAVAVDLDDTLWGGIVGEVGPGGLDLDPEGTGRQYLELQRLLLDLVDRGIPLAVVSKNDDVEARRPFQERPEMVLKLDSFVRFDASWSPKFEAIARFAEQLNIGIDAICFLDDLPKERDEARQMLPGLIVPDLPAEPAKRVEYLIRSRLFVTPAVSEEDRLRVDYFKRSAAPMPADLDEYLLSLQMSLIPEHVGPSTIDRVLSLLHKTNQFNVTLWRPTPAELSSFLADDRNYAYSFRLKDRLGDAGIVVVVLVTIDDLDHAQVAAWVMSCRVFGRGVEWAVAQHLSCWLDQQGISEIRVPYVPGPRNALVVEVLNQIGLNVESSDEGVTWFSSDYVSPPNHHITLEMG